MKTDELIDELSGELRPVPEHWAAMTLARGTGAGAAAAFLLMWVGLGIRPDLMGAMATSAYWIKFGFTLALAAFAFWGTERLARPGLGARGPFIAVGLAFLALSAIASMQLMHADAGSRMPLVMGHSSRVCAWLIFLIALPIFAGTFYSLAKLAPTRLVLSGAVAGFASGALGAWIYAFHCDESAAPFVLIFYTLGISLVGAIGALTARRLLHW